MDYNLAKQLSENGFPNLEIKIHDFKEEPLNDPCHSGWDTLATCKLCGEERKFSSGGTRVSDYNVGCLVVSGYLIPTLSELIEACGDGFPMLSKEGYFWVCSNYNSHTDMWNTYSKGSTPEEAVARLWLALNKK